MAKETTAIKRNQVIFGLMVLISIGAGIWGLLFPGRIAQNTDVRLLNINVPSSYMVMVLLLFSLIIILIARMKEWEIHIGSGITISSREISIIGSLLVFFAAFSFCGLDITFFFLYYYEMFVFSIYWFISMTSIIPLVMLLLSLVLLLIGVLLVYRKLDLKIAKRTISTDQSSNYLIGGVVSFFLAIFLSDLTQTHYATAEYDGFLFLIGNLPFESLLVDAITGFYQTIEFSLYPLVIFICGIYFMRKSVQKPSIRVFTVDFTESVEKNYQRVQGAAKKFLFYMAMLVGIFFLLITVEAILGLDRSLDELFNLQADLFQGISFLGFNIGAVPVLIMSFLLLILVYIPRVIRPFLDERVIRYSIRRLIIIIPIFIGVSLMSYALMTATGNPLDLIMASYPFPQGREALRLQLNRVYGLDSPPITQWFNWFFHFIMGDMGTSITGGTGVADAITQRIGPTLIISIFPLILTLLIAVPLGVYVALRQYSKTDNAVSVFVAIGLSVPIFLFILVLIVIFGYLIPILPASGMQMDEQVARGVNLWYTKFYFESFVQELFAWGVWDLFFHLIIPIIAITTISLVLYVRLVRSGLLEVIRQDYILSSEAYGFSHNTIIWKHAFQNVMIPIVTYIGLSIGGLLGGAPITETTLGWPGLGRFAVGQFISFNYPMVMGILMVTAVMILLANLLTDIMYTIIDPRVTL